MTITLTPKEAMIIRAALSLIAFEFEDEIGAKRVPVSQIQHVKDAIKLHRELAYRIKRESVEQDVQGGAK